MMRLLVGILVFCFALCAEAQELGKPSVRGEIELPLQLGNTDFKAFTESIVVVDLCFQYPVFQGFGLGVGFKGGLTSLNTGGDIFRNVPYAKLFHESMLGPTTMFEAGVKVGNSTYLFETDNCPTNTQRGLHIDPSVAFHFFANEFTSFGLTLGYEMDFADYTAELVCADPDVELYTQEGGNYKYLTFGIGFNVLFGKRPASQGVFN